MPPRKTRTAVITTQAPSPAETLLEDGPVVSVALPAIDEERVQVVARRTIAELEKERGFVVTQLRRGEGGWPEAREENAELRAQLAACMGPDGGHRS